MNKKWFFLTLWLVVGFYAQPALPGDEPLPAWDDPLGVRTLASAWLLLDKEEHNTRIRVYRMDAGELPCNDNPERTCHFERLAIGLATTGEHPMRKVYLSPLSDDRQYPDIVRYVDATRPNDFIQITLEELADVRPGKELIAYKNQYKKRTLFINRHEAYLQ